MQAGAVNHIKIIAMSHESVKSIFVIDNKVFIESAASDEWPLRYREWEAEGLTELWNTEGRRAVEKELLFSFLSGWMQGNNNFSAAIKSAEEALIITDRIGQYLKCCEDMVYRTQLLQLLHSYLDWHNNKTLISSEKREQATQLQLF